MADEVEQDQIERQFSQDEGSLAPEPPPRDHKPSSNKDRKERRISASKQDKQDQMQTKVSILRFHRPARPKRPKSHQYEHSCASRLLATFILGVALVGTASFSVAYACPHWAHHYVSSTPKQTQHFNLTVGLWQMCKNEDIYYVDADTNGTETASIYQCVSVTRYLAGKNSQLECVGQNWYTVLEAALTVAMILMFFTIAISFTNICHRINNVAAGLVGITVLTVVLLIWGVVQFSVYYRSRCLVGEWWELGMSFHLTIFSILLYTAAAILALVQTMMCKSVI